MQTSITKAIQLRDNISKAMASVAELLERNAEQFCASRTTMLLSRSGLRMMDVHTNANHAGGRGVHKSHSTPGLQVDFMSPTRSQGLCCEALPPARWDPGVAAKQKEMSSTLASHCCAEIPGGIPARIPQLPVSLQENLVQCPAAPAPKGTVAVRAIGPLDSIYRYLY